MNAQLMIAMSTGRASACEPSQSCLRKGVPRAWEKPKFGSSRALKAMPSAAAENSSGRK